MDGRIEGVMSNDGLKYEIRQRSALLRAIPLDEARGDKKLAAAIKRNSWKAIGADE